MGGGLEPKRWGRLTRPATRAEEGVPTDRRRRTVANLAVARRPSMGLRAARTVPQASLVWRGQDLRLPSDRFGLSHPALHVLVVDLLQDVRHPVAELPIGIVAHEVRDGR